jgi:hypothetical protein
MQTRLESCQHGALLFFYVKVITVIKVITNCTYTCTSSNTEHTLYSVHTIERGTTGRGRFTVRYTSRWYS